MKEHFYHHRLFNTMDQLSLKGIPFFFIVDFLAQNIEIFSIDQLKSSPIKIDFPSLKINTSNSTDKPILYQWEAKHISFEQYKKGFDFIEKNLLDGNSFLANYTSESAVKTSLSAEQIFDLSKALYKIYYPEKFICFSPETFIRTNNNKIFTYPMKGTIDASVKNAEFSLKNNPKEKSEHYTIVDLLRNDLSKVATNVRVTKFQNIEKIKTHTKDLLSMNSEICGNIKPYFHHRTGSLLKHMLPAGSISGAPKKKTLEIIVEAETHKRGFYTGISGFFDGKNIDSCVLIRFIEIRKNKFFFKSGGGITHQSNPKDEYQEMIDKVYLPIVTRS